MGRHLYVVLGTSIQDSSVVVLLEETKICPKEMETVVWDGWTRPRRVRENSDSQQQVNDEIAKMPVPHLASL